MASSVDTSSRDVAVSWPASGLVIVSFAAFALFRREAAVPVALTLAFLSPHLFTYRVPRNGWAAVLLRVVLYIAMFAATVFEPIEMRSPTMAGTLVQLFSRLCMAELVVQHLQSAGGMYGRRESIVILLTGIVFAAASKSFDVYRQFPYFALPYFFCLALTVRGARTRADLGALPWYAPRAWMHAAVLLAALALGSSTSSVVRAHRAELSQAVLQFTPGTESFTLPAQPVLGFSDTPMLGSTQNVGRSMDRVLRVTGALHDPLLRGLCFERYAQGRWGPKADDREYRALPPATALSPGAMQVRRLTDSVYVFAPLQAASIGSAAEPLQISSAGGCVRAEASAPFDYFVAPPASPASEGGSAPLAQPPDDRERRRCLAVPDEIDPGVVWLAKNIAGRIADPKKKIDAVAAYLSAKHAYSLNIELTPGADPVSDFLLNKKAAHCEYFASAATILLRCLKVPTRYVTGFVVHEKTGPSRWLVRDQDSHAWAESYVDGVGWITVDATPAGGRPESMSAEAGFWRHAVEWVADIVSAATHWFRGLDTVEWVLVSIPIALLAAALLWLRLRQRRAKHFADEFRYAAASPQLSALAQRFDDFLLHRGIPCPPHLTWQEHVAALSAGDTERLRGVDLAAAEAFVKDYARTRFGTASDAALIELEQRLATVLS